METITEKQIKLAGGNIDYTIKTSKRAKLLRLTIHRDGSIVVTCPGFLSRRLVEKFINDKQDWIFTKIKLFKNKFEKSDNPLNLLTRRDYLNQREATRQLVIARLKHFNSFYKLKYYKINIGNQKTRWGSCSRQGNLNFNFRLLHLTPPVRDYVIVHELCHLKEFNHSKKFWDLIAQQIPNFKELRKDLKKTI